MALWGGRFDSAPDALFRALNDSLPFDFALAAQDVRGSMAWARALARAGVLTREEGERLVGALEGLAEEVRANPRLPLEQGSGKDEDIHSWVERRLVEALGPLGKKLHTGRSRNDQVATDVRLWTRDAIDQRRRELAAARASLLGLAERSEGIVTSGYTHLQRAQPVLLAHWCLAHEEALARDDARLRDARGRVNVCPLGSGALAGTAYRIDRHALARDLGFDGPTANSLDATSDRDFILEVLAALSILAVHLSRLGEDLVLMGTQEFGLVGFGDEVSSGSSLMPQKKNPDAAELLRGKSGRIIGPLVSLLVTAKGLPLAYNKDLQEDKEPLFDAMHHASLCLCVVPRILDTLRVDAAACRRAAAGGHANATDLADYLVEKGMPFREAHDAVGRLVRLAIERGVTLEALPREAASEVAPQAAALMGPDVADRLSIEAGLARREVHGGTGPAAVAGAIRSARQRLAEGSGKPG